MFGRSDVRVYFGFSESDLITETQSADGLTLVEADSAVMVAASEVKSGYDKTDITLKTPDGDFYRFTLDVHKGCETIAEHVARFTSAALNPKPEIAYLFARMTDDRRRKLSAWNGIMSRA